MTKMTLAIGVVTLPGKRRPAGANKWAAGRRDARVMKPLKQRKSYI